MAARYLWLPRSHPEDPRAMPLTRLMAATDGSDHGDHAVDFALGLAAATGADLRVLGVETDGLPVAAPTRSAVRRAATADSMVWARGVPGVEIARRAEEWQADLLVLGRRSRTPMAPLQLGPTSDTVIRRRHRAPPLVPWATSRIRRGLLALAGAPPRPPPARAHPGPRHPAPASRHAPRAVGYLQDPTGPHRARRDPPRARRARHRGGIRGGDRGAADGPVGPSPGSHPRRPRWPLVAPPRRAHHRRAQPIPRPPACRRAQGPARAAGSGGARRAGGNLGGCDGAGCPARRSRRRARIRSRGPGLAAERPERDPLGPDLI